MKKFVIGGLGILCLMSMAMFGFGQMASQSSTILSNTTHFAGAGGNMTSSTVYGSYLVESGVVGFTQQNSSWGFLNGDIGQFEGLTIGITITVWNGSTYDTNNALIFSDCRIGQAFCEPRFQNSTPFNATVNRGILNITNTGLATISNIDFRLNQTCSWINFTFTNSSNFSAYPKTELNNTFRTLQANLLPGSSFDFYMFANVSTPNASCGVFDTEFDVT